MSKWVKSIRAQVKKILPVSKRRIVHDKYQMKEDLGEGNGSVVRRAVNKVTGEIVAIKVYDKTRLSFLERECISTEVEILKCISHPNVISLKESYDSHKKLYIVMEYMGGGELLDYIRKRKVFPEKEASNIFFQVISAISHLHSQGIVHRDVKPDNLLLTSTGEDMVVKLADFGFASRIGDGILHVPCGSPVYAAPEIVLEKPYDKSVDMWSAGVLLYILLCGYPPFYHRDLTKLFKEIEKGVFDFPAPQWTDISASAKELVTSLLKLNPSERLTAQQVLVHPWLLQGRSSEPNAPEIPIEKSFELKDSKEVDDNKSINNDLSYSPKWRESVKDNIEQSSYTISSIEDTENIVPSSYNYTFEVHMDQESESWVEEYQ